MINRKLVAKWFSGKALSTVLEVTLPAIFRSLAAKGWEKGASRAAHASLNKLSTATKNIAREIDSLSFPRFSKEYPSITEAGAVEGLQDAWRRANYSMSYGSRDLTQAHLDLMAAHIRDANEKGLHALATEFFTAMEPVWDALSYLDNLRPAPKFVMGETLSATVAKTITDAGLKPESLRLPEFKYEEFKYVDAKGKECTSVVTIIIWPDGTVHGATRFGAKRSSKAGNAQCHACAHAIRNPYNWVPVVFDNAAGVPHSMWVGRDCAKNLFDIDMTGEAEYKNAEGR